MLQLARDIRVTPGPDAASEATAAAVAILILRWILMDPEDPTDVFADKAIEAQVRRILERSARG